MITKFCRALIFVAISMFINNTLVGVHSIKPFQQIVTFSKAANDHIVAEVRKCAKSDEKIPSLLKMIREGHYIESEEFQNFIHCSYKNTGFTREDGSVDIDLSAPLYPDPKEMLRVMRICDKNRGSTPAENTFLYFKCFQEKSPFLIGLREIY